MRPADRARLEAIAEIDHWIHRLEDTSEPLMSDERIEAAMVLEELRDRVYYPPAAPSAPSASGPLPTAPRRVLPPIRYGTLR